MLKHKIVGLLERAAQEAQQEGSLPQSALPEITVERSQNPAHGDYACSFPLKLARIAGAEPLVIAEKIIKLIPPIPEVEKIAAAPPGFINFTLRSDWLAQQAKVILQAGESYGDIDTGKGSRIQLEFVSVNPTGPLHVGHGRGAILGSTLANVLKAAGYSVEKEYYVNDAGAQMDAFYRSLYARYKQALDLPVEMPADGYQGEYVLELAQEIIHERGDSFLQLPEEEAIDKIGSLGLEMVLYSIRKDLQLMEVDFDVWFSEKSLYDSGSYKKSMSLLQERGYVAEKEGAVWFTSSTLGEDKDNVLVRTSGTPTYFASDVAYHYNKFLERDFDQVIDIWGADHQGHVPRMKAVLSALGIDPKRLQVLITQMVMLKRGNVEVKLSKRSGDIITLRELVEEVGADACRYFFLSRAADSQMDFDLELAKKESPDNPVYYIQYAHARLASILRNAVEKSINWSRGDVSLLVDESELTLLRKMVQLPEVIEMVAQRREPHHIPYYAQELATLLHSFYNHCRVISEDEALTAARLKLVEAAKVVFARCLSLMGMNVPEKM
ncbi:arginine--tRNA ligase [Chloroflexota bacterium]